VQSIAAAVGQWEKRWVVWTSRRGDWYRPRISSMICLLAAYRTFGSLL
jgi:hypothetical protein